MTASFLFLFSFPFTENTPFPELMLQENANEHQFSERSSWPDQTLIIERVLNLNGKNIMNLRRNCRIKSCQGLKISWTMWKQGNWLWFVEENAHFFFFEKGGLLNFHGRFFLRSSYFRFLPTITAHIKHFPKQQECFVGSDEGTFCWNCMLSCQTALTFQSSHNQ